MKVVSKLELLWYRTEPPLPPSIEELWSALTDVLDRLLDGRISDDMRDIVEVTMRRNARAHCRSHFDSNWIAALITQICTV